jgi:hypothetical protein
VQITSVFEPLHAHVAHGGHAVPGVGAVASGSTHVVTPMPVHWYCAVPHLPPGHEVSGAGDASTHVVASPPLHVTLPHVPHAVPGVDESVAQPPHALCE